MDIREQKIADILLMPIEVLTRSKMDRMIHFADQNGKIETGMRYIPSGSNSSSLDCDVSDIAMDFYNVIYKKSILEKGKRNIVSNEFVGDTMNSIHKDINYHCLANFWILPLDMGRRIGKNSKARMGDRMEFLLLDLKNDYEYYRRLHPDYFDYFVDYDKFCEKHFLEEAYFDDGEFVSTLKKKKVERIIKKRAEAIAKQKLEELEKLFFKSDDIKFIE